jgi:hypothetical protein
MVSLLDVSIYLLLILIPLIFFRLTFFAQKLANVGLYMSISVLCLAILMALLSDENSTHYLAEVVDEFTIGFFPFAISIFNKFFTNIFTDQRGIIFIIFCITMNAIYLQFLLYLYQYFLKYAILHRTKQA